MEEAVAAKTVPLAADEARLVDAVSAVDAEVPLSNEGGTHKTVRWHTKDSHVEQIRQSYGTNKTVKARFWPWLLELMVSRSNLGQLDGLEDGPARRR